MEFEIEQIEKIRIKEEQLDFGVPQEHIEGHAFHTYTLTSPDKTFVEFAFQHNVCGRSFYAEAL